MTERPIPAYGTDELRKLEDASGWLCTCHEGWTSQLCPFHAIRIPLPEIQIRREGVKFQ